MAKIEQLKFNELAPDFELPNTDGGLTRLSSLWKDHTLLLTFTRHFGCPQCKEMIDSLVQQIPDLATHKLMLAVITQGTVETARVFCSERAPGILCLADPDRNCYHAYGLGQATLLQSVFSRRVMKSNKRLLAEKGWKAELPPPGQDAFQMSGLFIIGQDGRIRLPYYYDDISDHPPIDLLLGGVLGMDWSTPFDSPIKPE